MTTLQSEYALEEALLSQLQGMEYSRVVINDEPAMLAKGIEPSFVVNGEKA